jgi:hypothetical protein
MTECLHVVDVWAKPVAPVDWATVNASAASAPGLPVGTVVVWAARVGWAGVGVFGWTAVDEALAGEPTAVRVVAFTGAAVVWLTAVLAVAVAGVVPLTLARLVVPLALPAAGVAWAAGGSAVASAAALVGAAVTALAIATGDFGQVYAQASAYGHEQRFLLRPPPAYLLAAVVAWMIAAGGLLVGPLLAASGHWEFGAPAVVVGTAVAVLGWPRWHRLSRRWLVVVPAGLVVHDHLVLAETVMIPRSDLAAAVLAPAGTEAADLTGPAPGHPVELRLHRSITTILAGGPNKPGGTAIHMTACLVAPTRPGRALAAIG